MNPDRDLINAVGHALSGNWDTAHDIAQRYEGDPTADWLHATLHKMEGDTTNARNWYARTAMNYERFPDPRVELRAIFHELTLDRPARPSDGTD
ncbi:MAG: hypothetical protein RLZ98_3610 [Pseudomonadota bacterium]